MDDKNNNYKACVEMDYPCLSDYYAGKTVAITGGTGFLGQAIIEKLLRCCPQIKKIILFIRSKKGVDPAQRLIALKNSQAFDVLREVEPHFIEKLDAISCQLDEEGLGLSEQSKMMLNNEVNIFIHCAATLRFKEHLRLAYELNVKCVRRLMTFSKQMRCLQSFVHISTAYAHCDKGHTNEEFYDCDLDYLDFESSLKWMSDEMITKLTPDILGQKPNSYTLTKALAEDVIRKEADYLPVCIVRPSMIVPALQEPSPGWCNNLYGPTAFIISYQKGVIRSVMAEKSVGADIIPVDLVVNAVLAAAMKTGRDFLHLEKSRYFETDCCDIDSTDNESLTDSDTKEDFESLSFQLNIKNQIPIYNVNSSSCNKITVGEFEKWVKFWTPEYPLLPFRKPQVYLTNNKKLHSLMTFWGQTLPCYAVDAARTLVNKKRKMIKIHHAILSGADVMEYFFTHSFTWGNEKSNYLQKCLHPNDKIGFHFNARCISWPEYMKTYLIGVKKYILKEDTSDYSAPRKALRRHILLDSCLNCAAAVSALGIAATSSGLSTNVWEIASYLWEWVDIFV